MYLSYMKQFLIGCAESEQKIGNIKRMLLFRLLSHHLHPGRHGYDMVWSQKGSRIAELECSTILPQGNPPIHVSLMKAETALSGANKTPLPARKKFCIMGCR